MHSSLEEQVRSARAEMSTWSDEKRSSVQLEGTDKYHERTQTFLRSSMKIDQLFEKKEATLDLDHAEASDLVNFIINSSVQIASRDLSTEDEPSTKEDQVDSVQDKTEQLVESVKKQLDEILYGGTKLKKIILQNLPHLK